MPVEEMLKDPNLFGKTDIPVPWKPTPGVKQYTWREVAEHYSEKSAWVIYGRKVYDITNWLDKHPGGKRFLLLAAGRDITNLFNSYHPFSDNAVKVFDKYEIGEISTLEYPQYKPDSGFFKEIREKAKNYFQKTGKHYKDPVPGLTRLFFMLVFIALFYTLCVTNTLPFWFRCICAAAFGLWQAMPLLHSMHDASHTAIGYSQNWWISIGRFTMDWVAGACLESWYNQHILGHHLYTNVMGADPDVPLKKSGDIRRVGERQSFLGFYKFQHIYLLILYGLLALKFRVQDITDTLLDHSNGKIRVNLSKTEYLEQAIVKTFWMLWRIFIPLYYFQVPTFQFWVMFFIAEMTTGYFLAFNFQVSHVSPCTDWPEWKELAKPEDQATFGEEWAISQVKTTVDYAHDSPLAAFLCGALNYQTIHHLFPCVSQYHYPALAPLVKETCKKYNVPYHYVPTFWGAFSLHIKQLKEMGWDHSLHMH